MKTIILLAAGALGLAAAGCYADDPPPPAYVEPAPVAYGQPNVQPADDPGVDVSVAPVDIETYPSVVYEGQPTYFYGDRWWHRDGAGWSYYRSEPPELHSRREWARQAQVRRAPRAHEVRRAEAPRGDRR